jgi:hypothetical protein
MGARLVADAKQPGCYAIHGQVTVYEPINEQLTIFLAVSGSGDQSGLLAKLLELYTTNYCRCTARTVS